MSVVTTPTVPRQSRAGVIDGDLELDVEPPAPALQLVQEEDIVRAARAVEEDDPAEALRDRPSSR